MVGEYKEILHVVPVNDIEEHIETCNDLPFGVYCPCKCNPEHKLEKGSLIVIHNSFDGREGVEWTNEILSEIK